MYVGKRRAEPERLEGRWAACSQFLKIQVLNVIPDPGASNSCMHTFPEKTGLSGLAGGLRRRAPLAVGALYAGVGREAGCADLGTYSKII